MTVTHYQVHWMLMTFQGRGFSGQGHGQYFPKVCFSGRGSSISGLPSETM